MPESVPHETAAEHFRLVLEAWKSRSRRRVFIARNLAVRWLEQFPQVGIDPDVCVLEPPPEHPGDLASLCLWKAGHTAPALCLEVVSANHPYKDYGDVQDRYAALGAPELVVFDPLLAGPSSLGGPVALQIWTRNAFGVFERSYFGEGPAYCSALNAWLHPRGRILEVADDRDGTSVWLTGEARERAEKEREQRARVELERRVADLEAKTRAR